MGEVLPSSKTEIEKKEGVMGHKKVQILKNIYICIVCVCACRRTPHCTYMVVTGQLVGVGALFTVLVPVFKLLSSGLAGKLPYLKSHLMDHRIESLGLRIISVLSMPLMFTLRREILLALYFS